MSIDERTDTEPQQRAATGPLQAGATAMFAAAVLAALVVLAVGTEVGQEIDDSAMRTVGAGRDAQLSVLSVLGYVSIGAVALIVVGCLVVAALRGSLRLAVAAVVVIAGANVTTQLLKRVLIDRPDFELGVLNSLPSGHTTLVAASVAALALVTPRALQPVMAAGGAFAVTMVGASTVVAGWHRPSDVVAACAVTLAWTGAATLVLRHRSVPGRGLAVASLAGAAASGLALVAIGVRPLAGWAGFGEAAVVLGVLGLVVAIWMWLTSRLAG
ncbi:PAP2 family protein [Aeromicrobium marinum DSM 15272]|uniref:PAP2 family protein n=1 Tax=Aeromicrobium marinum DSM 15272 TaxID=585531 RepID=E2S8R3_9ACTN|nr:phosphatase PAP2 family protein [Aeromicrobium marinum]EFQ84568.1 PAP2 family protein [Aeromicrobium marinum DSM 15272]